MWAFWLISGISKQRVEIRLICNYTVMQLLPSTFGLFNPIHGALQLNLQQKLHSFRFGQRYHITVSSLN